MNRTRFWDMETVAFRELVLDSSALVAVLLGEKKAPQIRQALAQADRVLMSTTNRLEVCMVLHCTSGFTEEDMIRTEDKFRISLVPVSEKHAVCGFEAFRNYGKGNHRASLNFGDCHAYATAKLAGLPLLYIGNDFGHTDLESVEI